MIKKKDVLSVLPEASYSSVLSVTVPLLRGPLVTTLSSLLSAVLFWDLRF